MRHGRLQTCGWQWVRNIPGRISQWSEQRAAQLTYSCARAGLTYSSWREGYWNKDFFLMENKDQCLIFSHTKSSPGRDCGCCSCWRPWLRGKKHTGGVLSLLPLCLTSGIELMGRRDPSLGFPSICPRGPDLQKEAATDGTPHDLVKGEHMQIQDGWLLRRC